MGLWELRQFEALTGYDPDLTDKNPVEWWSANRDRIELSAARVSAYLDERMSQARLLQDIHKGRVKNMSREAIEELEDTPLVHDMASLYSEEMDGIVKRHAGDAQVGSNLAVEVQPFASPLGPAKGRT